MRQYPSTNFLPFSFSPVSQKSRWISTILSMQRKAAHMIHVTSHNSTKPNSTQLFGTSSDVLVFSELHPKPWGYLTVSEKYFHFCFWQVILFLLAVCGMILMVLCCPPRSLGLARCIIPPNWIQINSSTFWPGVRSIHNSLIQNPHCTMG